MILNDECLFDPMRRTTLFLIICVLECATGVFSTVRGQSVLCRNAPQMVDVDVSRLLPLCKDPRTVPGAVYADSTRGAAERALDLIRRMTFEEKLTMTGGWNRFLISGIERLGIRPVSMADASQGVRLQTALVKERSTSFPGMLPLASTWNPDLAEAFGRAMGEECRALGVDVLLGPGINIQRLSVGGRNFEYMGEDPWLTATMATAYIRGLQSRRIIASPKHFVGNDQDFCRHIADSRIDERTLREVYLLPWEMAVKEAGVQGIMTGNNPVNGVHAALNRRLLHDLLRVEYGFDGLAMTDWQSTNYYPGLQHLALTSGETLLMPDNEEFKRYVMAECKRSPERRAEVENLLERMIFPTLHVLFRNGIYDRPFNAPSFFAIFESHKRIARQCGQEAIVLLKNEGGILPIDPSRRILLAGDEEIHSGTGSGYVVGYDHVSYADGLQAVYGRNLEVCEHPDDETVRRADIVFFRLNKDSGEGKDIPFEEPVEQLKELDRLTRLNENVVVLISACNVMPMDWLDRVKGVLWCYFLGQERGHALADVVSGKTSPSGRLPFTVECSFADSPDPDFNYLGGKPYWKGNNQYREYWLGRDDRPVEGFSRYVKPGKLLEVSYDEGVHVGYRWYDRKRLSVHFPFGFGLSYTTFEYRGIEVEDHLTDDGTVSVGVTVRNAGQCDAAEVVQLYVSAPGRQVDQPKKALKAYDKVMLRAGEEHRVVLKLDRRSFSYWNSDEDAWEVEPGQYRLRVGGSSRDLPLEAWINVK